MSEVAGHRVRRARPMTVAEQGAEDWAPRRHGPCMPATLVALKIGRSETILPSAMEVTG